MKRAYIRNILTVILIAAGLLSGCNVQIDPLPTVVEDTAAPTGQTESGQTESKRAGTEIPVKQSVTGSGTEKETVSEQPEQEKEETSFSEEKAVSGSSENSEDSRKTIGLTKSGMSALGQAQNGNYYYELCDENQKVTYLEIYQTLLKQAENIRLTTIDSDSLSRIYQCVINDHPELFYLGGYTYTKHTVNNEVKYLTFTGKYLYSETEVAQRRQQIEKAASSALAGIQAGADQYSISKYLYEYLILHTEYGTQSTDNQNIYSVFMDHVSVCNGYAKAAQYLFDKEGIPCILVNGTAGGGRHAWNIVKLDGAYYQFDTTWGDPSYYADSGTKKTPDIDYDYLNLTTDQITMNHEIDETFPVPACTTQQDNYFVREGLYFSSFDEKAVSEVFKQADAKGEKVISIQASGKDVYDQLYNHLITKQKIFDYYKGVSSKGNYSVAYTSNDTLFTLSFWK